MKRPMLLIGISFSVASAVFFAVLPGFYMAMLISTLLIVASGTMAYFKKRSLRVLSLICASVSLALVIGAVNYDKNIEPFNGAHSLQEISFKGVITASARPSGGYIRYSVYAKFTDENKFPPAYITVYHFGEDSFSVGDIIGGQLKPIAPKSEVQEQNNFARGVMLTGSLKNNSLSYYRGDADFKLRSMLIKATESLKMNISNNLPPDTADFVRAMVMGERSNIAEKLYYDMQVSGIAHLIAVSGLHLNVFCSFVLLIIKGFKLSERIKAFIALMACFVFCFLVGFSPSLLRALCMTVIVLLTQIISKRADTLNSLGIALLIVALCRPVWLLGFGIWISAASCAGIALLASPVSRGINKLFAGSRFFKPVSKLSQSIGVTIGAYLFTMPLLFIKSGWISILAPLINILVIPFTGLTIVCGMLCAFLPTGFILTGINSVIVHFSVEMIKGISSFVAESPFAAVSFDKIWKLILLIVFIALLVAAAVLKKGFRVYISLFTAFALSFSVCFAADSLINQNRAELVLLRQEDGEAGSIVMIRNSSAVILKYADKYAATNLISYLKYRKVTDIDMLVLEEHSGRMDSGLLGLYDKFDLHTIVGPDDEYILAVISKALPGVSVYSAADASAKVLGGISLMFEQDGLYINVGDKSAFIYMGLYDIINNNRQEANTKPLISLKNPDYEPVGQAVYNETRYTFILE